MTATVIDMGTKCPHCHKPTVLKAMPEGYATDRWGGYREEVPYLRCPKCTATFPSWGVEEYQAKK